MIAVASYLLNCLWYLRIHVHITVYIYLLSVQLV